jgi:bifunctional non-homologous end joining protein LigD
VGLAFRARPFQRMVSKRRDSQYRSGRSTNWLKIKSYAIDEIRAAGRGAGGRQVCVCPDGRSRDREVCSAFINSSRAIRERLWKRVQEGWVGRVKHLRGEENLRHASLQDFREE